ncbi:rice retrotransposon retrofit gag pol polyprotein, partial [Moniliophthora roreri MCA 2997]
ASFAALPIPSEDLLFAVLAFPVRLKDWLLAHDILGHPDDGILDQVLSGRCGKGFEAYIKARASQPCKCNICVEGKSPQLPYAAPANCTSKPLELVYMDTCGPFPVTSPHRNLYFQFFLDDFTNANAMVFLKDHSQVP